jgi:hypothetical protein
MGMVHRAAVVVPTALILLHRSNSLKRTSPQSWLTSTNSPLADELVAQPASRRTEGAEHSLGLDGVTSMSDRTSSSP